jgi:hypothetical protein
MDIVATKGDISEVEQPEEKYLEICGKELNSECCVSNARPVHRHVSISDICFLSICVKLWALIGRGRGEGT